MKPASCLKDFDYGAGAGFSAGLSGGSRLVTFSITVDSALVKRFGRKS